MVARSASPGPVQVMLPSSTAHGLHRTVEQLACHTVVHGTHFLQVSVYPYGHEKTKGLWLERQPNSRRAKRLELWRNTPRGQYPIRPGNGAATSAGVGAAAGSAQPAAA